MVILITGRPGAGKTWYAVELWTEMGANAVLIDGDLHRRETGNNDFSDRGRLKNLLSAAKEAAEHEALERTVIMAFVAPKREWRDMMREHWSRSRIVYIPGGSLWPDTTYEVPCEQEIRLRVKDA